MKKQHTQPLSHKKLYQHCDPKKFTFTTTAELKALTEFIGQNRAVDALRFGVNIRQKGYNLYCLGPSGIGKHSVVQQILTQEASKQTVPSDWCYVYNFAEPHKPTALELPAGYGVQLRADMQALIDDLNTTIPAIFDSEEYRTRMQKISDEFAQKQKMLFKKLDEQAKKDNLLIASGAHGFTVAVTRNGEVLTEAEFSKLSDKEQAEKQIALAKITEQLKDFVKEIPRLQKGRRKIEKKIQDEFTLYVVEHAIDELRIKYKAIPAIIAYLTAVQLDMIENVKDFLAREETRPALANLTGNPKPSLSRYKINVLVDHSQTKGAPVIYEDNPNYPNLMGRIEHVAHLGTLVADFTLIKSGALHRANGGYLIIDVMKMLAQPFVWDGLKRALYALTITIEPPAQLQGYLSTVSLEPISIPLDVKVILLGDRHLYYLLSELDPDFMELFKVAADFEEHIENEADNLANYVRLIATLIKKEKLCPFHCNAVARVIEYSARLVDDAEKLSLHMRSISDLLHEANYWAQVSGAEVVQAMHVQEAIDKYIYRANRVQQLAYEEIQRGMILILTSGKTVGQINALSVEQLGNFVFGIPTRVTAIARVGKGEVIDIEREVELGGPMHSKGVLIISGYLAGHYAKDSPLSLTATLVFEQTYSHIEGDSASVAELCALVSAIAQIPIKQSLAVTGSINQHGEVQAVGGVNEKIEGFFAICKQQGLTGEQGVLIPTANVKNLMLKDEVVQAVAKKKFNIYPIDTIDTALTLVTGLVAGERNTRGRFPPKTVNYYVEKTLQEFAKRAQKG